MRKCAVCRQPSEAFLCEVPACRETHNRRCREYQQKKRAEYAARGESYRNRWTKGRGRKSGRCIDCGGQVGHGKSAATRCRRCWNVRLGRDRRSVAARKLERAAAGSRGARVWTSGRCWRCGEQFLGQASNYCSRRCYQADKRALRRARERGAKITPGQRWRVFERDDWTCRICGDPVNREAKVPALDAPVLDHRIPLAAGGEHAPENWQTA